MTWVKLDDRMPEHPKVADLSDRAFRAHVEALCYCAGLLTDGRIPLSVAKARRWARSATELVMAGVWEVDGGSWRIHDYLDHQRSRADAERLSETRAVAGSKGGRKANTEANDKQIASDARKQIREDQIREEEIRSDPIPQNPPTPRKRGPHEPVDEPFIGGLVVEFADTFTEQKVRDEVARALNHKSSAKWLDKRRGVRDWLKRESEYAQQRAPTPIRRTYAQQESDRSLSHGPYEHLVHRGVD